ncbi:MAG: hypothetical protein ACYCPS_04140 [Candidatus Saccharimonadales bacterium]
MELSPNVVSQSGIRAAIEFLRNNTVVQDVATGVTLFGVAEAISRNPGQSALIAIPLTGLYEVLSRVTH